MAIVYLTFIVAMFMVSGGTRQLIELRKLLKNGEKVQATVAGVRNSTEGRFYKLAFENKGGMHHLQYKLPRSGKELQPGEKVTLYYDPADPDRNHIAGSKNEVVNAAYYFALAGVIFALGIASFFEIRQ